MTQQQRIWMAGRTVLWAVRPLALYLFMPGLCVLAGMLIRRPAMTVDEFFASSANFYTAAGMAAAVAVLWRRGRKGGVSIWQEARFEPRRLDGRKAALCAAFGMAASIAVSAALTLLPLPAAWTERYAKAAGGGYGGVDFWFLAGMMLCLAPFLEEIIFRGLMLGRLMSGFGERTSQILAAALFALCHADPIWSFYAFFMGLILGKTAVREENTAYSAAMHAGFNLPSLVIYLAGRQRQLYEAVFGSRLLIAFYGLAAALAIHRLRKRSAGSGGKSGGEDGKEAFGSEDFTRGNVK